VHLCGINISDWGIKLFMVWGWVPIFPLNKMFLILRRDDLQSRETKTFEIWFTVVKNHIKLSWVISFFDIWMLGRSRPVSLRLVLFYLFVCICTCNNSKDTRRFYFSLQLLIHLLCKSWQLQQLELSNGWRNVLHSAYPDNKKDTGSGRISPLSP
jgi:hypothetical protein